MSANSFRDATSPRSPDFICGGTQKVPVYSAPTENEEMLQQRISDACQTIRNSTKTQQA
jgi:hypothetical protein